MRTPLHLLGYVLVGSILFPLSTAHSSPLPSPSGSEALHALEHLHYSAEWEDDPVGATLNGLHSGDALLPDISDRAQKHTLARITQEKTALSTLDLSHASQRDQDDRDILLATLKKERLYLEDIQPDRHQPDDALSIVTEGLYGPAARQYAPAPTRLKAVISRMEKIPAFLKIASQRLTTVPAIYKEIALENLSGTFSFIQHDIPAAFHSVKDPTLQKQLAQQTQKTLAALKTYQTFIQDHPSSGSFALGRQRIIKLLASDMIDLSPDSIMQHGEQQLEHDYADFWKVAHHINAQHPERALEQVRQDHPTAEQLIPTVQQQLGNIQHFVQTHHLVSLPSQTLPLVRVTPGFEQALISAATEWPGPFETTHLPSFYDITPPSVHFSPLQKEQALQDFNRPELLNITIHEVMPGHFVQGLFLEAHPNWSLVRRNGGSYTTTEGWAHYVEQMMIEQGVDNASPSLQLMQLQDALLRDCRLLVSFGMHMKGMSLSQATNLMQNRCLQSPVAAYKEARRGTADPGYFSYTLGKMMILRLRSDIKKQQGSHFSLQKFHDNFLNAGLVPVRIIRRELTGQNGSLL